MIRWGILGAGNIARRFLKSLAYSSDGNVYAIASYTSKKRAAFQKEYGNVVIYDDYYKLLDDPNVDVVYIATQHKDHYRYAKAALKRKKAVLCEKPATLNYETNKELCELARVNNTFFMEAMKSRFIPLIKELKKLVKENTIGDITNIETCFAYNAPYNEKSYLFDSASEQGGILNDVGNYNIAFILDFIKAPLTDISSKVKYMYDVDANDQIELVFSSGQRAFIDIAFNEDKPKIGTIYGTLGKIIIEPFYRPQKAKVLLLGKDEYTIEVPYLNDDFYTEISEVHNCLINKQIESSRMSFQDSLKIRQVTDEIRKSFLKK